MKMKSVALLGISGLLTAALGYAVPAMADDVNSGGTTMQSTMPATTDTPSQNNAAAPSNDNSSNSSTENPTSGSPSSDEGNPDTPSGDDDY